VPAVDTTGPPLRLGEDECHYLPSAPFVHHSPCRRRRPATCSFHYRDLTD
jgi:hypothetical protein